MACPSSLPSPSPNSKINPQILKIKNITFSLLLSSVILRLGWFHLSNDIIGLLLFLSISGSHCCWIHFIGFLHKAEKSLYQCDIYWRCPHPPFPHHPTPLYLALETPKAQASCFQFGLIMHPSSMCTLMVMNHSG